MYKLPVDYTALTPQQRREVREQYIKEQNNLCFYCNLPLNEEPPRTKWVNTRLFPDNFFKYPIHLQHDHDTNMTEGAVHNYCNAVMWQYEGR